MKHKIALITDSTCDLPLNYLKQYNIEVVPLTIIWGEEQFRDGVDLAPEDFYRRLETDQVIPTTSQPTPQEMVQVYEKAKKNGAEEIVILTISNAMSGTHESAKKATELVDIPVHVQDSKSNTMSLGWQVLAAARAREAGGDVQTMLSAAKQARDNMVLMISLDTLKFLHKGGRIGGAQKFLGTALNFKPILEIIDGAFEGVERIRTRTKALNRLVELLIDRIGGRAPVHLAAMHANSCDRAAQLIEMAGSQIELEQSTISEVSPAVGVHLGPGAVGFAFMAGVK